MTIGSHKALEQVADRLRQTMVQLLNCQNLVVEGMSQVSK